MNAPDKMEWFPGESATGPLGACLSEHGNPFKLLFTPISLLDQQVSNSMAGACFGASVHSKGVFGLLR